MFDLRKNTKNLFKAFIYLYLSCRFLLFRVVDVDFQCILLMLIITQKMAVDVD